MENREFISAANLPTTEANEVDVLCVENGELKRKAASGLGGGNYDAVILVNEWYNEPADEYGVTFTLESGSHEALVNIINSGKMPKILLHGNLYYGYDCPYVEEICAAVVDGEQVGLQRQWGWANDSTWVYIHSDNTVDDEWRES